MTGAVSHKLDGAAAALKWSKLEVQIREEVYQWHMLTYAG
jgi:hypothetical protein